MSRVPLPPGILVVGTDTGVGKTVVAAAIARALVERGRRVGVLKPVATGMEGAEPGDARLLLAAVGADLDLADACPIRFAEPLAPPVAARRSGRTLGFDAVIEASLASIARWRDERRAEVMIVEGVGGLLCPIAEGATVADLAIRLDYPIVIVARRGLGTLNHTLLTVEAANRRALRVVGLILNGAKPTVDPIAEATNPAELARRLGPVPILAEVPHQSDEAAGRASVTIAAIDWYALARRPRLDPETAPRPTPMPSSGELLLPPHGGHDEGDPTSDPTALEASGPQIGRGDSFILDDAPSLNIPLGLSGSDDGEARDVGSSTFTALNVAPDPIVGALGGSEPPESVVPVAAGGEAVAAVTPKGQAGDDVEIEYVSGPNWPMVVLASYASAVTLALVWFVILPRFRGRGGSDDSVPSRLAAIEARRADRSRQVDPPPPIDPSLFVDLGQTLKAGLLEITPVDLTPTEVRLRRVDLTGKAVERPGGTRALALRLRLRNSSANGVFAPLDESFLREPDDGLPASAIELPHGSRAYLYPLPIDSEWSIVGETFPDLKPGETAETRIISAADFPDPSAPMTWRLTLRTDLEATTTIGVKVPARN